MAVTVDDLRYELYRADSYRSRAAALEQGARGVDSLDSYAVSRARVRYRVSEPPEPVPEPPPEPPPAMPPAEPPAEPEPEPEPWVSEVDRALPRLLAVGTAAVERRAPDAPEAVKDYWILRLCSFLADSPGWTAGRGLATALRSCGAASGLSPWTPRPAVRVG